MNLLEIANLSEEQARELLEGIRWPNGVVCPHCGNTDNIYNLDGDATRKGLYKCAMCRKQFTVTVNTILHGSHLTIKQWVVAFYLMCSHKKGISAAQMQRELGLETYKSAWHLCHRIRLAMQEEPLVSLLHGVVECDETYIGGKSKEGIRGRGSERKTPVFALIERNGRARSKPVEKVDGKTLKTEIKNQVDIRSTIMTDEWRAYRGIGKDFKGGHEFVCHSAGEYLRGDVNTNSAESFFALLKRGIHGTFHHVSKKHLLRYCDEFSFRWSYRKVTDFERMVEAVKQCGNKRLLYKDSVK